MRADIFDELFVLELANNHWGQVERGIKIIDEFSKVVRFNNVKAAIKLQLRDADTFVHKAFRDREDIRYVKKTMDTRMSKEGFKTLAKRIQDNNCLLMATVFDEASVAFGEELELDAIKIASSDIADWFLIKAIAALRKPTIVSTAGSSIKNIDDIVRYFSNRGIPLAINHCVAIYPTDQEDLKLNQIDFLIERYPDNVIGLSTHEDNITSACLSMIVAYSKGARTFERHIDIDNYDAIPMTPYCFTPKQIDEWFKALKMTKSICGVTMPRKKELDYLRKLHRGAYAKKNLSKGHIFYHESVDEDLYLAIPCQDGQVSSRELANAAVLKRDLKIDEPLMIEDI